MRVDRFLRTPVRADHQDRMQNLNLSEIPISGNPTTLPYPQSLEISFTTSAGVSEIQIAPLWEGYITFIASNTSINPTNISDVSEGNYPNWSITGDLILRTWGSLDDVFKRHIPLITPAPAVVCYSGVKLTKEFLFTTVRQIPRVSFIWGGARVDQNSPQWFEKFIVKFLSGKASIPCLHHESDPTQDFALKAMPSINLKSAGDTNRLYITISSFSDISTDWFLENQAYDGIDGVPIVDPVLATLNHQLFNPLHPNHSVIPPYALFQEANGNAYATDHSTSSLRTMLSSPRTDNKIYRRIDLLRPPIPGERVSMYPQRPYPTYQLCWSNSNIGGAIESLRIPLSGRLYLLLEETTLTFWSMPRNRVVPATRDVNTVTEGDSMQLSVKSASVKYIGLPQTSLNLAISTDRAVRFLTIYAHLFKYDWKYIAEKFKQARNISQRLKDKASADWNVEVLDWTIPLSKAIFNPIYGYIKESAGRHNLAPEFLHAVFMGEGANLAIERSTIINSQQLNTEILDGYGLFGLDLILYRIGKVPSGKPPYPPEIPSGNNDERDEYQYNLETNGYIDPTFSANVTYQGEVQRTEAGFTRTLQIANIIGWRTVIELVAAELHQRLDEMVDYCRTKQPPISVYNELSKRYLSYVRFNARFFTAKQHADNLSNNLAPWRGTRPVLDARYNSLQRLAVAQWYENTLAYR